MLNAEFEQNLGRSLMREAAYSPRTHSRHYTSAAVIKGGIARLHLGDDTVDGNSSPSPLTRDRRSRRMDQAC